VIGPAVAPSADQTRRRRIPPYLASRTAAVLASVPALVVILVGLFLSGWGCASRPAPRRFTPAGEDDAARALAAWRDAVARAQALGPSRLLYGAKIRQGLSAISGTLALETAPPVHGTLTGPFGSAVAAYSDGSLHGDRFERVEIEPQPLLWLLAGVWDGDDPQVGGVEGEDTLLIWNGPPQVEAVLHVPDARFTTIRVRRGSRSIEAAYEGKPDPWPPTVTLTDVASGSSLRLVFEGRERLP
jgi:hypothetical protein